MLRSTVENFLFKKILSSPIVDTPYVYNSANNNGDSL